MTLIFIHLLTIETIGQQNDDAPSKKCHQLPNKTTENNDSRPFSHKQPLSHSLNVKPSLSLSPTHTHTRSSALVPSFSLVHQIHFVCLHLWMKRLSSFFVHWWKGHNNNNCHVTFEPNLNINHLDQAAVLASMTSQLTGSPDQSKRRSVIHWYFPLQSKRINTTTANLLRHFWSNNDWIQLAKNCDKKSSVTR